MKKRYQLAILFTQAPFGSSISREGLDAVLAASAFCDEDELAICFLHDGVFNLVPQQQPELILQKDHLSAFKLLDLYELDQCFICQESIAQRGLTETAWLLPDIQQISQAEMLEVLQNSAKVLTF